jgi:hypothetical protein
MRALSSARSHNRRESRRQSKRLAGESSDSSRGKSPIPLQPMPGGEKVGATIVTSPSEEESNSTSPMHAESEKSIDAVQADVDYDLEDSEAASITRPLPIHYVRSSEQIFISDGGLSNHNARHAAGSNDV